MFKLAKAHGGEPFFHRALLEGFVGTCLQSLRSGSGDYKSEAFYCNFWQHPNGKRTVATTKSLRMKVQNGIYGGEVLRSVIPVVLSLMHFLANNKSVSLLKALVFDFRSQGAENWLANQLDYQEDQKSKKFKRDRKFVPRGSFSHQCTNSDIEALLNFAELRIAGEPLS
jgi:hypothetical protein